MSGGCLAFQWAMGLDMTRGGFETDGAFIEMAVDVDVTEFPALKAGFMVVRVVMIKGYVMVATGPPDFGVGEGSFFFLSERGHRGGGG